MRDIQEELARKDTDLHKMEVDLVSSDEERKRFEDQVRFTDMDLVSPARCCSALPGTDMKAISLCSV